MQRTPGPRLPPEEAINQLSETIEQASTLVSDYPDVVGISAGLSRAYETRALLRYTSGDAKAANDDMVQAVRYLTKESETNPTAEYTAVFLLTSLSNLASSHDDLGETAEADKVRARRKDLIRRALDAQPVIPGQADGYLRRGLILMRANRPEDAVADFTEVIKLDPQNDVAYRHRAQLLQKLQRFEEALNDWTKLTELDPKDGWAHHERSVCRIGCRVFQRRSRALIGRSSFTRIPLNHIPGAECCLRTWDDSRKLSRITERLAN